MKKLIKNFGPVLFFIIFIVLVIWGLGDSLIPILIASILAYIFLPLVQRLEKIGIKRQYSVSISFALCTLFNIIVLAYFIPRLFTEMSELFKEFPQMVDTTINKIEVLSQQFGINLNLNKEQIIEQATKYLSQISMDSLQLAGHYISQALTSVAHLFLTILNLLLIPVFFFYLLFDFEKIVHSTQNLIPKQWQKTCHSYLNKIDSILSAYIRGQILVSIVLGFLYGTAFSIVGIKFGFLIGFITGLLNIIPYAGPSIGLSTALISSIAQFEGYHTIIGVLVAFGVVQGLESFVITPKIIGDKVGLNSLQTMIALIIGGNLLGIVGMLIAIPFSAILKIIFQDLKHQYLQSDFYNNK